MLAPALGVRVGLTPIDGEKTISVVLTADKLPEECLDRRDLGFIDLVEALEREHGLVTVHAWAYIESTVTLRDEAIVDAWVGGVNDALEEAGLPPVPERDEREETTRVTAELIHCQIPRDRPVVVWLSRADTAEDVREAGYRTTLHELGAKADA